MKIIIAANIYPPEVGGPAYYTKFLEKELKLLGHEVCVVQYGLLKRFPTGIRHFLYFLKLTSQLLGSDVILSMDTFSVGIPVAIVSKLFGKKTVVRIGGDFLWEAYVERTKEKILLSEFYKEGFIEKLNIKEKFIFKLTKWAIAQMGTIIFTTSWQENIWRQTYNLSELKVFIIKNSFPKKETSGNIKTNRPLIFLWAGRDICIKNTQILRKAFNLVKTKKKNTKLKMLISVPRNVLQEEIKKSRALIIPSFSEVSPNIILESISLNTPFILTKDTGLYEKFRKLALLIDPRDENDIAQKILQMTENEEYEAIMKNMTEYHYPKRGYDKIAQEFINIFNKP